MPKGEVKSNSLGVTDVRLNIVSIGTLRAFVSVTFNKVFCVTGITVVEGNKGLFVGMPSKKGKDGTFHDVAFPITKEGREELVKLILDAYEAA